MRLFENVDYSFIRYRHIGYGFSLLLLLISLGAIFTRGLQYGIDFKGGTEVVVKMDTPVPVAEIRSLLEEALGAEPMVRNYGSEYELQIRTTTMDIELLRTSLHEVFNSQLPGNTISIIKADTIGPVFARDMQDAALMATWLSIVVIALYIFIRFKKVSFSFVILTTLVHDVIIILGIFTLFHGVMPFNMDIDQSLVAAFLTIIGYSLNDTIVVFDRIRENLNIHKGKPWGEIVNTSINQTLSRTVVTSLSTLLAVVVLFFAGGATLKGFSFAILTGVILGTYSTICVSCPLLVDIIKKQPAPSKQTIELPRGRAHEVSTLNP